VGEGGGVVEPPGVSVSGGKAAARERKIMNNHCLKGNLNGPEYNLT